MTQSTESDWGDLYSAVVADILDGMGHTRQTLSPRIAALTPANRVAGRAFTVRAAAVDEIPDRPYELEMAAIDEARPGDVLVVDAGFLDTCAFWGELLSTACLAQGIGGIVMSACTRDMWALRKLDFPVFGTGRSPADSKGRLDVVALRETITIGGVEIRPGDGVLGDEDGVVIIPGAILDETVATAREKIAGENTVREELAAGIPVAEVFRRHGIL